MTNVIGFAGIECYDIILYLGSVLTGLGQRVLLSDCSESEALRACIDAPKELEGEMQHYAGMDFIVNIEDVPEEYDYVLIDFGKVTSDFSSDCSELYLVTDYQKHNVRWTAACQIPEEVYVEILFRDRLSSKVTIDSLIWELKDLGVLKEDITLLEDTESDLEAKLLCQYNSNIVFHKISERLREFIVKFCGGNWGAKEVIKVIKKQGKGVGA